MKKIVIIGAGGFGREIQWLIERINKENREWELVGFLDDGVSPGKLVNGVPVLGGIEYVMNMEDEMSVVCAIGNSQTRKKIIYKIEERENLSFPNLIDTDVQMSENIRLGHGNIICAGSILTVDIEIKDFVIINLGCTVGHDAILNSFATVYPSVNISGMTKIGSSVELGTGVQIIQGIQIGDETIVGAGAVVTKDLPPECTAVGVPAKPIKIWGGGVFKCLLIVGAGGHGDVIADMAMETGVYDKVYFLDDNPKLQRENVIGDTFFAIENRESYDVIVAIGNSEIREKIQKKYEEAGVNIVTLIHPQAYVASDVKVGRGTVIMAGAVVQSGTEVGKGVIINTASTIDHDNKIGNFVHISPGAHLGGTVQVGDGSWIGLGSSVINNINICERSTVGAGAVVVKDITEPVTVTGIPARTIKKYKG